MKQKTILNRVANFLTSPIRAAAKKNRNIPAQYNVSTLRQSVIDLTDAQFVWSNFFNVNALRREDKIISYKGRGKFDFYYEMIDRDGTLSGLIENRIDAVAGLTWDVKAISDDDEDKEIAAFVKWALARISHFGDDLADILAACVTGYSVSEIVWGDAEYEGGQVLVPEKILGLPPDAFRFGDERELRLLDTGSYTGTDTREWPMKLMVYSFRQRNENPYGVSLLRSIYWAWWFKHQAVGYWLRACEVGAEITPVFRYDPTTSEAEVAEITAAAQQFLKAKYIVCPDTCEIQFPAIKIDPEMASVLVSNLDTEMRFRVLGSTLSSGTDESGSRALGEVHEKQEQKRKEHDAKSLEAVINETLIRWIVQINIGEISECPVFKMDYETAEDQLEIRENIKVALESGIPLSQAYVAERLNLRLAAEGEPLAVKQQPAASPFGFSMNAGDSPKKVMAANAATITDEMKRLEDGAIRKGKRIVENIRKQAVDWIGTFDDLDEAAKSAFDPDLTELGEYIGQARFLAKLYGMYRVYGIKRIVDKLGTRKAVKAASDDWTPISFEEAIERFRKRKVLTREEFDLLMEAERNMALTATGMSAETIRDFVKVGLLKAMEEGTTMREFQKLISDVAMSKAHAENIFRTNVQSAYNSGHAEAMYDPRLKDDIPGFQIIGVPDDRQCEICAPIDGQIYTREEMLSQSAIAPFHFLCRCTLIPIFIDEWSGPTKNPNDINNLEGFGSWKPVLNK